MTDQDQIDQLLDRWSESVASGHETTTEQLCAEYPHLRPELDRRIRAVKAIEALRVPRDASATVTGSADTSSPGHTPAAPIVFGPARQPDELGPLRDYRVLKQLGEGGMGVVYLAEHDGLKRLDALKVMKPEAATTP